MKERLDVLLVQKGFTESREKAKRIIMTGVVFVDGQRVDKAGTQVPEDADIEVKGSLCPYVSRGGIGDFTPMNANFGIVPLPEKKIKGGKLARNEALAARSLAWIDSFVADRETPES